ncbi:MAG: cell division protein FtsQ [Bacteroidota bacterium]
MKGSIKVKKYTVWGVIAAAVVVCVGFIDKKQEARACENIIINIDEQSGNYFITEDDIIDILTSKGERFILGTPFEELNLKFLEKEVRNHSFVHKADVFRDIKGTLIVNAKQCRPIARILTSNGESKYVSQEGEILPLSKRFTARVPIIAGNWTSTIKNQTIDSVRFGTEIFELLEFIDQDEFWKAQIAQLKIDRKGNVELFQQVGKQIIELGKPEELEDKFERLKIFYDEILPRKGWNHYEKVSLAYRNQIVCE